MSFEKNVKIQVICIGHSERDHIQTAIFYLNGLQNVYEFQLIQNRKLEQFKKTNYFADDIYQLLEREIGYGTRIIGLVKKRLDEKIVGNLFSSMQKKKLLITGRAIVSLYGINQLFGDIPIELYLIFELLSTAIRFSARKGMIHRNANCIFDRKMEKADIIEDIILGRLCDKCFKKLKKRIDADRIYLFRQILNEISNIARSNNPKELLLKYLETLKEGIEKYKESRKIAIQNKLHLNIQEIDDKWLVNEFLELNRGVQKNTIINKLILYSKTPDELSKYLIRVLKLDNWSQEKKELWAEIITELLEEWYDLKDPMWQTVLKALTKIVDDIIPGEELLTNGLEKLMSWIEKHRALI